MAASPSDPPDWSGWPALNPFTAQQAKAECVHFTTPPELNEMRWDGGRQIARHDLDGNGIERADTLFERVAEAMSFPSYFGGNWDALDECLRDLDAWIDAEGFVLVIDHADDPWASAPLIAGGLVQSWQFCNGDRWLPANIPFHLIWVFEGRPHPHPRRH